MTSSAAAGRWIVVSGVHPDAGPEMLCCHLAGELALQHHVLLWDVDSVITTTARTCRDLAPYSESFSPHLLRNFLSQPSKSIKLLRGPLEGEREMQREMSYLLKNTFDYLLILTPPSWEPGYLSLLDEAQAVLLVGTGEAEQLGDLHRHLEEFARHKYPRDLGQIVLNRVKRVSPEFLLQSEETLDRPIFATVTVASFDENVRALAQTLATRSDLYERPLQIEVGSAQAVRSRIHGKLLEATASSSAPGDAPPEAVLEKLLARENSLPASREVRGQVFKELMNEVTGLGPLEPLLKDPDIAEIMVNGPQNIFVEKKGRLFPTNVRFDSETQLRTVIDRIVAPIGRRVDESTPLCDGRLSDGSRVNIVLPPLALDGATLTIRKFMQKRLGLEDLLRFGALNEAMAQFLTRCVQARKNIVVSGGTGSGKTTLLNILSSQIAPDERIVTIEDAAELRLQQPHVVRLESRPVNAEGEGAIPIRRLVINALRMRPDRIVVGECRGGEALDMLQAMNTGHDGSLTTLHANSPRDALGRLEALVLMAGMDLPVRVVREQIKSAVHLIIQIARLTDGSRKIISITEITGMEGDVLTTAELFRYRAGAFESTGLVSQRVEGVHAA